MLTPTKSPLVTLALTTMNRAAHLRETLKLALAQDYENLEILVSDNGSKDETPVLAQELIRGEPRARFRRNEITVPIHEHFTQCLKDARGEFFILFHDDDRINESFVSELVRVAMRHPEVQVVLPANATIDSRGAIIEECVKPDSEVLDGPDLVCRWLNGQGPRVFANVTTVLARTAVMLRFGGYQGFGGGRNIDNLIFLQCAIAGPVGFARGAQFYWRVHESFGQSAAPEAIVASSSQFINHLLHDPATSEALARLPGSKGRQIVNGVMHITSQELLCQVQFSENLFRWKSVRNLFSYRRDWVFLMAVLTQYNYGLRRIVKKFLFGIHEPSAERAAK